jgi:glycyl-tRNA synthetase (class II)
MKKYQLWLLIFLAIFAFTFSMIIWTVMSASKIDINEDKSFASSYHIVDNKFNDMMISSKKFVQQYDVKLIINDKIKTLNVDDVFLSQRALEKNSKNKNMLKVGQNSIKIKIIHKATNKIVSNAKIEILLTRATVNHNDIKITDFDIKDGIYYANANIDIEGNWNITGYIEVNNNKGYFYYKTKSIK